MGIIYKITNILNDKIYIGQTKTPLEERMRKHYSNAKNKKDIIGIDAAIQKYGKHNFKIDILTYCDDNLLDELEKYYISKYNSFSGYGYNLTPGGQDHSTWLGLDEQLVIDKYQELKNITETANYFNCCDKTISNILHKNNVFIENKGYSNLQIGVEKMKKPIKIIELDKTFDSMMDCGQWLIDNNYSKAKDKETAKNGIRRALKKERNGYCGLHFELIDKGD